MVNQITWAILATLYLIASSCKDNHINKKIIFEPISDTEYGQNKEYVEDFSKWKQVYEKCMNHKLFTNAGYLGLQGRISVGSINNQSAVNINGKLSVIDTTFSNNFYNLIAFINSANCYTQINLTKSLQGKFYSELTSVLTKSGKYAYLNTLS